MPSMLNPGPIDYESITDTPTSVIFSRAPDGQLNFQPAQSILKSLRQTSEWTSHIGAYNLKKQRESIEAIRGVETYLEPVAGGVVQLDNTYDHAFRVRDGSYLLTNDPNFNPGQFGIEADQLKVVP